MDMRTRSFAVVFPLLLLSFACKAGTSLGDDHGKPATVAAQPGDALWHFDTHG